MIGAASPMPELPVTPFPDAPDAAPHPLVTALAPDLNGDDNHQRRRPVEPPHAGSALGRRVREAVTGTLGPLVSSLGRWCYSRRSPRDEGLRLGQLPYSTRPVPRSRRGTMARRLLSKHRRRPQSAS